MLLLADGKTSHWWHWRDVALPKRFSGLKIKGDSKMMSRSADDKFSLVKVSLGGWKNCYILELVKHKGPWFFAFDMPGGVQSGRVMRCLIMLRGPCRILQGNKDGAVYGMDRGGREVGLRIAGYCSRKDRKFSEYPLI